MNHITITLALDEQRQRLADALEVARVDYDAAFFAISRPTSTDDDARRFRLALEALGRARDEFFAVYSADICRALAEVREQECEAA